MPGPILPTNSARHTWFLSRAGVTMPFESERGGVRLGHHRCMPLRPWAEIQDVFAHAALLLGNGASRAVWSPFHYESLYEMACSDQVAHPLAEETQALFGKLGTTN